jgi:hypothetical protein
MTPPSHGQAQVSRIDSRRRRATGLALVAAVIVGVAIGASRIEAPQAEAQAVGAELRGTLAIFEGGRTATDDVPGDPAADLQRLGSAQPGENPSASRRAALSLRGSPAYLWPMTGGVCSSWGNCVPVSYIRSHGIALSTEVAVAPDGSYTEVQLAGIVRDGIGEVRFLLADGDEVSVPVRDNVFWVDMTERARPTEMRWDDAAGPHTRPTGIAPASALLREFPLPSE